MSRWLDGNCDCPVTGTSLGLPALAGYHGQGHGDHDCHGAFKLTSSLRLIGTLRVTVRLRLIGGPRPGDRGRY